MTPKRLTDRADAVLCVDRPVQVAHSLPGDHLTMQADITIYPIQQTIRTDTVGYPIELSISACVRGKMYSMSRVVYPPDTIESLSAWLLSEAERQTKKLACKSFSKS